MKTRPSSGFTLIETVTAMAVIIVLTGLVMSIAGYVQRKAAQSRANGEIAMLAAACESYKADSGAYPRDVEDSVENSNTDRISPREHFIPTTEEYEKSSRFLYKELSGDRKGSETGDDPDGKPEDGNPRYLKDLDTKILKVSKDEKGQIKEVKYLQDPYGYPYAYSTAAAAAQEDYLKKLKTKGTGTPPSGETLRGFNPAAYDLWSTGGSRPSAQPTDDKKKEEEWAKWLKNW